MAIVLRNMAKTSLPAAHKQAVLSLYLHASRNGDTIRNYRYSDGVAYLPPNKNKLIQVAAILGEDIEDLRSPGTPCSKLFQLKEGFTLRPHQVAAAPALLGEVLKNKYAVIQAGCGLGKTVILSWVAGCLNRKILVLVDMGSLLSQWQEAFEMVWGEPSQILKRGSTTFGDVCITTFQLLHANPSLVKRIAKEFGCLLLDEFHTTQSNTRREVLFRLDNEYRIGCSATPWKKNYSDDVLTDLVADISIKVEDQHALKPSVYFVKTGVEFWSNNPDWWGRTTSYLARNEERNNQVVKLIARLATEGRKILFIGLTIDQCQEIGGQVEAFQNCHPTVYTGSTSLKQDRSLKERLAEGSINCILTVKKADKGLDLPSLDCLILARPHNNKAFLEQISGRVVRYFDGKPDPLIYDFLDVGRLAENFARNRRCWYERLGYSIVASIAVE